MAVLEGGRRWAAPTSRALDAAVDVTEEGGEGVRVALGVVPGLAACRAAFGRMRARSLARTSLEERPNASP